MNKLSNFSDFGLSASENVIGGRGRRSKRSRRTSSWSDRSFSFDRSSWCQAGDMSEDIAAVAEELEQLAVVDTEAVLAEVELLMSDFGMSDIEV